MNSFDLTQVVSSPTYVSHNGKEILIDLALILSSSKLKECSVIPPLSNSDHDGVHLVLRMLPSIQKTTNNVAQTIWRYQVDFTRANAIIRSTDWSDIDRELDIKKAWSLWHKRFMEMCIATQSDHYGNPTYSLPWFNNFIRAKIKKKNHPYKRALSSRNSNSLLQYKKIRNEVVSLLRKTTKK